jgi:hypothetical protein
MAKWFQRSLMALGVLFIAFIPLALLARSAESDLIDNLGIGLVLLAFALCLVTLVSGLGALSQWLFRSNLEKAKRGLAYEDAMLNRIMSRLNDEERSYLQGYLNAAPYEPAEDFYYANEENSRQDYK